MPGRPSPAAVRCLALLTVLLGGAAQASPATDLYEAALARVKVDYFGWSTVNLKALQEKYAALLRIECAPTPDTCDYAVGRSVVSDLLKEFGDAHTNIRDPEAAQRLQEIFQDAAVQRTGARVVRVEGGLLVASIMPGSPAQREGLRVFDLLTTVNGQNAGKRGGEDAPIGPNQFMTLERSGRPITVTVKRAGQGELPLILSTQVLKARDVPTLNWLEGRGSGLSGRTALITYPSFLATDASELFLERVQEALFGGAQQLLVDLRFNGGGTLTECVAAASTFAPVLYKTQYRQGSFTYSGLNGESVRRVSQQQRETAPGLWKGPLAVLVGPDTASCAEVFTYYAQRAGALVVGAPTRGVGNSGVVFEDLPDGGLLAVTILKAFSPEDQPLPERITPDVLAPTDIGLLTTSGQDTTLEAALQALSSRAGR